MLLHVPPSLWGGGRGVGAFRIPMLLTTLVLLAGCAPETPPTPTAPTAPRSSSVVTASAVSATAAMRSAVGPGTPGTTASAPAPANTLADAIPFQKGMVYASFFAGQYTDPESDQVLAEGVRALGADWVSIVVTCYQDTISTVQIICGRDDTPTDGDLARAISTAHRLGMKVMLKPHIDLYREPNPTAFRGDIAFGDDESAWRAWFTNYTAFIAHYAQVAQTNRVESFAVGTELRRTSGRAADWRAVIRSVRGAFRGTITYAANFDEVANVPWWDAVDYIGVDAYYPLAQKTNPTVAELKAAWQPIVARLGELSERWKRPIVFTEIGYQSRDGTARKPHGLPDDTLDLQEQADCYEAAFQALTGQPWWRGAYWWLVVTTTAQGGPQDTDYSPIGKPAAAVLRRYYGGGPRG